MTAQHQASGATGSAPGANLSAHTPMMQGCLHVDFNVLFLKFIYLSTL
ncbi:hypothetical protein ACEUCF_09900 [Aeromonas veronii]